ncbi:HAD family hydrolase [Sphingomonas sp.]|uniref:HAD-IIIC family phosphatase n=1 Tax=Sphingomonas sp. TaxID=28214 RepID=UPI000DB55436|nr:HAD-IIIC family phosphatase [Sphingomonas sp.]PZU11788.1 MAG: haloacid dehalogenase [Sphingomonas sp.]
MSGAIDILPWLLPPAEDFRARVRAIGADEAIDPVALRTIANTALDVDQLDRFGRLMGKIADRVPKGALTPLTLGLIGSHTLDYAAMALVGTGVRHGLLLRLVRADYGQVVQSVLDPSSTVALARPDMVLLSLDPQMLNLATPRLDADGAAETVKAAIGQVRMLRDGIRDSIGAVAVLQTLPLPADPLFGGYDARVPGSPRAMIEAFNRALAEEVVEGGDLLIDIAFAAASHGLDRWHDPRGWHSAKMPFALEVAPLYADHVCRVLGAAKGKARKCLVLDLDNTLWGGIIGDDGVEGIKLGQGNAAGEAFLAIQTLAFDLRRRGVILAVCSKNEDANARLPFREHADMLLREEHIAAFVANWTDKATNLRDIAATLNIGTDALVFLDDNPAERAIVRRELPEVAVPEVGADPSLYPGLLARAGYFEAVSFADEDLKRAEMYRANSERRSAMAAVTNIADYLASLEMQLDARGFDLQNRARISQLVNKSNQFNLTTRRYGENDIGAAEADPERFTLQLRLVDKFGDNGMISVIIFDKGAEAWDCDTWLMSCRVLGRRVEEAALAIIAEAARAAGAKRLTGRYIPTAKNGLVERHFDKLGFSAAGSDPDGTTFWELPLDAYAAPDLPMAITRG